VGHSVILYGAIAILLHTILPYFTYCYIAILSCSILLIAVLLHTTLLVFIAALLHTILLYCIHC